MASTYYEIQVRTHKGWSNCSTLILPGLPQSANRWPDQATGYAAIEDIISTNRRPRTDYRLVPVTVLVGGGCF